MQTVNGYNPTLTLFVDSDGNFNPQNPSSDAATYVPGSDAAGVSVFLPQAVQLIAAYTDGLGQIVTPPASQSVTFSLTDVSAFAGIAMNASLAGRSDSAPDFELQSTSAAFGADKTARVFLNAWDYGGSAKVTARQWGKSAAVQLPLDINNNRLPDGGWITFRGLDPPLLVSEANLSASADTDDQWKNQSQIPLPQGNSVQGQVGDGLSVFEEYRGFVADGVHYRLNPSTKDLFASSLVLWNGTAHGLGFALQNLPLVIYRIRGEDETPTPEYRSGDRVINPNRANAGVGGNIAGFDQKALRIKGDSGQQVFGSTMGNCVAGLGGTTPNETALITIYADYHFTVGQALGNTQTEIQNEIDRTIGHELGHGTHILHRGSPTDPSCNDGNAVGTFDSIMSSPWFNGPPSSSSLSQYNDADVQQIRLHVRF